MPAWEKRFSRRAFFLRLAVGKMAAAMVLSENRAVLEVDGWQRESVVFAVKIL